MVSGRAANYEEGNMGKGYEKSRNFRLSFSGEQAQGQRCLQPHKDGQPYGQTNFRFV